MGWGHMSLRVSRNGMETYVTEGLKEWDGDTCH